MVYGVVKISVYSFTDLSRSYSIVQFEGDEIGRVLEKIIDMDTSLLKQLIEHAWGDSIRGLSIARGKLYYRDQELDMVYLRIELEENKQYIMEIYRESAMVISNTKTLEALSDIKKFMKTIEPGILDRKTMFIGF